MIWAGLLFNAHFTSLIIMKYFPKWNSSAGLKEKRRVSRTSHIVLQFKVSLKIRVELTRSLLLAARRLLNLSLNLKRGEREVCEANIGKRCCSRGKEWTGKARKLRWSAFNRSNRVNLHLSFKPTTTMIRYNQTPLSSDQTFVAAQIVSVLIDTLTVHVNQE